MSSERYRDREGYAYGREHARRYFREVGDQVLNNGTHHNPGNFYSWVFVYHILSHWLGAYLVDLVDLCSEAKAKTGAVSVSEPDLEHEHIKHEHAHAHADKDVDGQDLAYAEAVETWAASVFKRCVVDTVESYCPG